MPRVRGRRPRAVNPAGLDYRQRLRARNNRVAEQDAGRLGNAHPVNRGHGPVLPQPAPVVPPVQPPVVPQVDQPAVIPAPVIPPVQPPMLQVNQPAVLPCQVAPPQMQIQGAQADPPVAIQNGEQLLNITCNDNNAPMLMAFSNELDIFIPQTLKDKIWAFEYTDLSLLLRQNFNIPNENQNCISINDGRLVVQSVNKPVKKNIENISMWTDAFINYVKILIMKHPLLSGDLLMYMAIIRGAISDAPFDRVYMYDQQFRLRMAINPNNSWSNIDGTLWLRFIAKGSTGVQNSTYTSQRPCYDYNFKKACFRRNCIYRHSCMKCGAFHPAAICNQFGKKNSSTRKSTNSNLYQSHRSAAVNLNIRPPLLGNGPQIKQ